jgi:outer membrane protein
MTLPKAIALALSTATILSPAALARQDGAPDFLALGIAMSPDHPGSDDYRFRPFGAGRVTSGGISYQIEGPGISATLLNDSRWDVGAYGRWMGGRDDDIDDAIVSLLPEQDNAIIGGLFARYRLATGVITARDQLSLGARIGTDVTGTYDDAFWSVSARYSAPLSRSARVMATLSVSGSGDSYADALFSVDAAGSAASGLSVFDAEGGIQSVGLTVLVDQRISDAWSVTAAVGGSSLQTGYADSPIVVERGDEQAFFVGLGIGRQF